MRRALNLATDPYVNQRPFWVTVTLLALLAVGLTAGSIYQGISIWRRGTAAQARLYDLQTRRDNLADEQQKLEETLRQPDTLAVLERAQFFNQMISQKRLSFTRLLFDLQQVLPAEARILSLSPKLRDDGRLQVSMRVGAQSDGAIIELLEKLGQSGKFTDVKPDSVSSEGGEAHGDAVVAQVTAVYMQGD